MLSLCYRAPVSPRGTLVHTSGTQDFAAQGMLSDCLVLAASRVCVPGAMGL